MGEVSVKWTCGEQFVAVDSTKHSVVLSSAADGTGMKPSDLLLVALAGCSGIDVVRILAKQRQEVKGLEIKVSGVQEADPPWTFREIHVEYTVRGKGLADKSVERAIELSETKYCSVGSTLSQAAKLTHSYQIIEE